MILRYVVDVLVEKTPDTPDVKEIREQLADWSGIAHEAAGQRVAIVLTVPADSVLQAFAAATRIIDRFGVLVSVAVATEEARAKPDGWDNVPDLVSVQQVATAEGRSKQAILTRISKGQLDARKVGQEFLVLRSDMP